MGESGTGKTYCIRTLLEAGIQPFVIFTEPGMEVISDLGDKVKWTYIKPTTPNWASLEGVVRDVNTLSYDNLLKKPDGTKSQLQHYYTLLKMCQNFTGQGGVQWGDVTEWGTNRALVIDSLSGLSDMARQMTVGLKPVMAQHEWGEAQNLIEQLVNKLATDMRAWLVVTAHIEREVDEVTGGSKLMVSTLGRKLAPKLPRYFSDVIQVVREGDKFTWDTAAYGVAAKARNIPIASKLPPSFVPLANEWKRRGGIIESEAK